MANTAQLKKEYAERIAPALKKQFNYTSVMQIPVLKKIVVNQRADGHHWPEGCCHYLQEGRG